jgi:hypothetical protein
MFCPCGKSGRRRSRSVRKSRSRIGLLVAPTRRGLGMIRGNPLADLFARTTVGPQRARSRRQVARSAHGGAAASALAQGDARHPAVGLGPPNLGKPPGTDSL